MSDRDAPDILIFPPLASVTAPITAVALEWICPLGLVPPAFSSSWIVVLGILALGLAGTLAISGERAFRAANTNVDPRQPALTLVETGPYRFTRNPMYLGMVVLQIGLGLTFSLDWTILTAPILWAVLNWGVVTREETYLAGKFGAPYAEYLTRTRRWI